NFDMFADFAFVCNLNQVAGKGPLLCEERPAQNHPYEENRGDADDQGTPLNHSYSPLTTILPILSVGAAMVSRKVRSFPIISIPLNIWRRFPAIVISCTG